LAIRAVAEVAIGITIEIAYLQFTRISDSSVAITDRGGETQFLNLDTGAYR
jgi:sulfate adenylyltransferase subunit 1 (EFTu-like GTPase family)